MTVTLGLNISSLKSQRQLSRSSTELTSVFERLSSGQRINKASDDAAGLAIADSLNSDARVFNQGVRNLNDGISLLNIADGALSNLSSVVIRLQELAEQSANGVYSQQQRAALDNEAQALKKEYFRIAQSTEFNGRKIFTGSGNGAVNLQAGFGVDAVLQASVGGAIGNGALSESSAISLIDPMFANALALNDLNGDGFLDLIAAGSLAGNGIVTISLGKGDGSFSAVNSISLSSFAIQDLELGDVNGDGTLDILAVADDFTSVLLGDGSGSFSSATTFTMGTETTKTLDLADLNNDGVLDIISGGTDGLNGTASIRLGNGDGSFATAISLTTLGELTDDIITGDLNNDGILDLITSTFNGTNSVATVRLGNGDGTFETPISYAAEASQGNGVNVGDLNRDGNLDLVTIGRGATSGEAIVRLGNGDGTFGSATTFITETLSSYSVELKDLNGDGILDLATVGLILPH